MVEDLDPQDLRWFRIQEGKGYIQSHHLPQKNFLEDKVDILHPILKKILQHHKEYNRLLDQYPRDQYWFQEDTDCIRWHLLLMNNSLVDMVDTDLHT